MTTPVPDDPLSPDTRNLWPAPRRRTWFAILGAPAAWGAHIMLGWFVSGNACLQGSPRWGPLSAGGAWVLQAAIAVLCIGTAAAALWIGVLDWRASGNHRIDDIHASARPDFLAATAVLVSAAFLLATVYNGLAQLLLPLCEATR